MIDAEGRKQAKREHDDSTHQLHPGFSPAHRSTKPSVVAGHRMSAYQQGSSSASALSRPRPDTDYPSTTCRQFVDDVKQPRTSSEGTCRQQLTSLGGDGDISSCGPPGASPQCQYFQPPSLPSSYSDQLYYAATRGHSAMTTGSAPSGLYNPYDPVVAAGLHRLQQAGHMMGSPCGTASPGYTAGGGGYYAGLMAGSAGGTPYMCPGSTSQYHCSGVPYGPSTHHQMSSLMNLAGSAAAAACITPPSPPQPTRMQPFISNSSL